MLEPGKVPHGFPDARPEAGRWARIALASLAPWFSTVEAAAAPEPAPYHIEVWQAEHGLPQSSVTSIVQTRDGYLWLGTFNGLVRFDGVQFKVFGPNNAPGLPSSRILQLLEDSQGTLWIGTEEGSVAQYKAGQFQTCLLPGQGDTPRSILGFAEAADGTLWIRTSENRLIRFAAGQFTSASTNWDLRGTAVNGMAADVHGQLWITTEREIAVWRGGRFQSAWEQDRRPAVDNGTLTRSGAGGCWVAGQRRVRRFDHGQWLADYGAYPWAKGDPYCTIEDRHGQLWIGTYGSGLFCYATNRSILHFSTEEGLPGDLVRSLHEDHEGNIWVGTEGHGLARLKPAVFRSYGRRQGLSGDCVLSACEGEPGELWVGTNGDGVDRLKEGVVRHYGSGQGLANEFVWSVLQDRSKNLWAGTWGGGLFRLIGETFVPVTSPGASPIVCALYEDSEGGLWAGHQRATKETIAAPIAGVLRWENQITNANVRAVLQDGRDSVWIGTHGDGLYRIQKGRLTHFGRQHGLNSDFIRSLYADADGVLWIATYGGGLNRMQDGTFTAITTKNGLVNDSLCYLTEDNRSNLWCGSIGGVFRASKAELNRFAHGQTPSIHCFAYTKADGLPSLECSGGCQPSGCKTRDGRLWFPTVRGLAVVDPEDVPINPLPPPVVIEEVQIDGKFQSSLYSVPVSEPTGALSKSPKPNPPALRISPGNQRLEFRFTGLSLTEPKKVQFKYKLTGLEEEWVDAGTRRTANYSYLRPGDYRFCVVACNNDGVWNETGATLALTMLPYFWQTSWFRVLGGASVVFLFVAAYEMRLASQRKLLRLRLRIARDLHDEVGSNLGSIALLTEVMPKSTGGAADEITEIRRIAAQTIGSLRDIVWFLDPTGDNLEDLVMRMKDTAKTMLPGLPFEFVLSGEVISARPSLELRRNVFPMFKEILHNVAKHARASRVEILVKVTSRQFLFRVSDDGIGFDETKVRPGNGLKNLRRRAAELAGTLEIRSQPGHGASVELSAPIT